MALCVLRPLNIYNQEATGVINVSTETFQMEDCKLPRARCYIFLWVYSTLFFLVINGYIFLGRLRKYYMVTFEMLPRVQGLGYGHNAEVTAIQQKGLFAKK